MNHLVMLSLLAVTLPSAAFAAESRINIARAGKSTALIVVADNAAEPEKYAAEELRYYLNKVTGGDFQITNEYSATTSCLLVGPGAARLVDGQFSVEGLGADGIVIRSVGKDLILAGGAPRGTLYAVYTFLEDHVGCRWWAPGESTVPSRSTLQISSLDVRYVPPMEYREPYWGAQLADGEWCAPNKINGARVETNSRRGGSISEIGSVHSFYLDIQPGKYFRDHPDWYSEVKGKRTAEKAQLCMTNEGLIQEYSRIAKEKIRSHPGVNRVWVSQNDWGGYCECRACTEINHREGTPAGSLIYFVNAVAKEVEKDLPEVAINTLAYDWSQKPPKTLKPRGNVVVWLCTTGCRYNVPYTHKINTAFRENLDGWAKIHDRIYIWDYTTNYSAFLCPHPNIHTLGPNIKYFARHGVRGVFSVGAYSAPGAEMLELRSWVTAKLLWDPSLSGDRLIDEFLSGYYGPAGKHIRAYLNVFRDAIRSTGEMVYMFEQPVGKQWLGAKYLCRAMKHVHAAGAVAQGDPDLRRRVEVAELPLLYAFLVNWDVLEEQSRTQRVEWPFKGQDIKQVYERFQAVRAKYHITQISESNQRDVFASVQDRVASGLPSAPPGCENMPRDRWAVIHETGFTCSADKTSVVEDAAASNGRAVYMPANTDEKLVSIPTRRIPLVYTHTDKPIRVKLAIRVDTVGREGIAFRYGMDTENRTAEVKVSDVKDGGYGTYDLGVFKDLRGWGSVWIGPADNPGNVKGIWLDRVWLVRE